MWRKIYIHTCQNKQRIAETILKCTKILKQDVVHQELRSNKAVGQIHFKEQTQKNRSDLWLPGAIGGGPGRRWPKVQTVSYKVGKYYGRNVHSGKRG